MTLVLAVVQIKIPADESLEKVVSGDFPSPDKSLKVNLFSTNKSLVKVIVDFPSPDKSLKKVK